MCIILQGMVFFSTIPCMLQNPMSSKKPVFGSPGIFHLLHVRHFLPFLFRLVHEILCSCTSSKWQVLWLADSVKYPGVPSQYVRARWFMSATDYPHHCINVYHLSLEITYCPDVPLPAPLLPLTSTAKYSSIHKPWYFWHCSLFLL